MNAGHHISSWARTRGTKLTKARVGKLGMHPLIPYLTRPEYSGAAGSMSRFTTVGVDHKAIYPTGVDHPAKASNLCVSRLHIRICIHRAIGTSRLISGCYRSQIRSVINTDRNATLCAQKRKSGVGDGNIHRHQWLGGDRPFIKYKVGEVLDKVGYYQPNLSEAAWSNPPWTAANIGEDGMDHQRFNTTAVRPRRAILMC